MIIMRKVGMIFLSVIVVVSLAAYDSGDGKTKKVTEEQTESVKPTEKATESVKSTEEVIETTVSIQEEAATEIVTGAVSQEDNKKADSKEQQKSDENTADSSNKQNNNSAGTRQEAANTDNSDNGNAGDDNGTANAPADSGNAGQDSGSQQATHTAVSYSPQTVVSLSIPKIKAGGKLILSEEMNRMLSEGTITQEEYNEYYPYDGTGYFSIFVETDLKQASTIDGQRLPSEDAIAQYIADMLIIESVPSVDVEYAGVYTSNAGNQFYEFRCHR
ncbi:hypothetical protein DW703_07060 [Agathobacter rectalis]|uniref:GerMN domain-containing protein n=2 Tax=Agathobacter rectalis TaxID=39491 RepID=A0A414M5C9_9FIRM|nr:hypothetical protein DW703_07060 [Agathobacter rectalis]